MSSQSGNDTESMVEDDSRRIHTSWRNWFIYFVLIGLVALFGLLNENFFSLSNFANIARQVAMLSIAGFGMTFVITSANIDLSVGSVIALVSVVATLFLKWGFGIPIASLAGILTGMLVGFINGIIVTKAKIPAFLVTLGMLSVARGTALTITGTRPVTLYSDKFQVIWGSGTLLGLPTALFWVVGVLILAFLLYNYSTFGNHVKATGGNLVAAQFSGINTDRVIIKSFLLAGFCTAIAGLIMTSRIGSGRPDIGVGMELNVIAAVILGGTSLFGGKGSVVSTLIGALIMTVITNGLIILGVEYSIQTIITGAIIIAAVSLTENSL